jgi:hypothetical protein
VQGYAGACCNFGCSRCLQKAKTIDRRKQYLDHDLEFGERTRENSIFFANALQQYEDYDSVCGVKGLSVWGMLQYYDYAKDCVVDPMHHIYLHVVKEMMDLWFSEKYSVCIIKLRKYILISTYQ